MKNFTFFFVFFLVAFLSFAAMAQVPTDSLQLWLKADEGIILNGSTVSSWIDQSGKGNNALQSSTNRQPLLVNNALNDKPVLQFDGIDDRLGLTGSTTMSQISLFLVFKIDSGLVGNEGTDPLPYFPIVLGNANTIDGEAYGLSMRNFFSANSPDLIDPWVGSDSWVHAEAPNIAAYDQWKVLSAVTNQNMWNTTVRSNGVDAVITPQGTFSAPLSVPLGTPNGTSGIGGADDVPAGHLIFKGDIAEVLVYNKVLSDSERLAVENYLADKYNISNTSIPTAGLQLWLKADEGVTLNGSTVSSWIDQSGNGNDVIQTNATRQPLLVANTLNGKPVISFDGLNDKLGFTGSTIMTQFSLFLVINNHQGTVGNTGNVITFGASGNFSHLWYMGMAIPQYGSDSLGMSEAGDGWVRGSKPGLVAYDQWRNLSVVTTGTIWNTTLQWDGNNVPMVPGGINNPISVPLGDATGSGGGIGGADGVPVGTILAKCDVAEVIVYNRAVTDSERLAVENYLADKYNIATEIEDPQEEIIPEQFTLSQNYPNPFNPSTKIKFQVPNASFVNLKVYDILGKEVAALVNEEKPAGNYEISFNALQLSSGIYFYKLQAGSFVEAKKMILLK